MKLSEFTSTLSAHPAARLEFVFDDGEVVPPEFHVTEVGHVTKRFIDCGGTERTVETVQLQAWVSPNDPNHRLSPGKLASILGLAARVLPPRDLEVEIEYEGCVVSQSGVSHAEPGDGVIRFHLVDKHTDCLAKTTCGIDAPSRCGTGANAIGCC